jgi:signal transduction histidine kinase
MTANRRIFHSGGMKSLFMKLYSASIASILLAMYATFYLLWYQWQPENNYNLQRFYEPALYEISKTLKTTPIPDEDSLVRVGEQGLPMTYTELNLLRQLSAQMNSLVSLIFTEDVSFTKEERQKIVENKIVYHNSIESKVAYLGYDENRVIELELTRLKGSSNQWMSGLIYLAHYSQGTLQNKIERVKSTLSITEKEPEVIPLSESGLSRADLTRLKILPRATSSCALSTYQVRILHQPVNNNEGLALIKLEVQLSPALFPSIVFIPVISLLIGLALWITLRPYVKKTCQLSKVTQRFSEGELQARVGLVGSGPIERLAQQFDQAADHVVGLLRAQDGLLKAVAHELRTPISRLYFYGDLLSNETDDERRDQLLKDFNANVGELADLTDELLSKHRYKSGSLQIDLEPINLSKILRDVCRESLDLKVALSLSLNCPQDVFILGEYKPTKRMVTNLVTNASRYASNQLKVSLYESQLEEDTDWIELWVEDDGEGIPKEKRDVVFDPFFRLDESRDRSTGGIGLGLTICSAIVKALGGEIAADQSRILGGARFVVKLPVTHLQPS